MKSVITTALLISVIAASAQTSPETEATCGIVIDENRKPVAGARVFEEQPGVCIPGHKLTKTGADGSFCLNCDQCYLVVAADDYAHESIFLPAGSKDNKVLLRWKKPVKIVVKDAVTGQPISSGRYTELSQNSDYPTSMGEHNSAFWGFDFNGPEGLIEFETPYLREHRVYVFSRGYAPIVVTAVPGGETITAALEKESRLTGKVVDVSGTPVPKANLYLTCGQPVERVGNRKSDENGAFGFSELANGHYRLSIRTREYVQCNVPVQLDASETKTITVELVKPGIIEGHVVGNEDHVIVKARLVSPSGGMFTESTAEGDAIGEGKFALTNLAPGDWQIYWRQFDNPERRGIQSVTVKAESTTKVTLK